MRILSILMLCCCLFGCQKSNKKTEQKAYHLKDSISIHSHSIRDTFKFSKAEFKSIVDNHPEINLHPPLHPEIAYQNNDKGFNSETGQDVYFTIYAYNLEKYNHNREQFRTKLIEAFHKVNNIHGLYKRGGSFFGHQKARIAAYAEFDVYSYRNKKPTIEDFNINKEKFIERLKINFEKGIVKMVNSTENTNALLLQEINIEISELEKLIDNDIILKAVRDFEQRHYNYDKIDLVN
jgi:hypothetical protein